MVCGGDLGSPESRKTKFSGEVCLNEPTEESSGRRITDGSASGDCLHCKCDEDTEHFTGVYSASREEKNFWKVEDLGTESPYRCVDCRNCVKCRNGDELEAISFKEEAEQCLIEASVQLDPRDHLVWAHLPFVLDPVEHLKENRFIAEKVLKTQMALFRPVCYYKTRNKISFYSLECASRIVRNLSNRTAQKSAKFAGRENPGNTYKSVAVTEA
jgi:hypothetical protein